MNYIINVIQYLIYLNFFRNWQAIGFFSYLFLVSFVVDIFSPTQNSPFIPILLSLALCQIILCKNILKESFNAGLLMQLRIAGFGHLRLVFALLTVIFIITIIAVLAVLLLHLPSLSLSNILLVRAISLLALAAFTLTMINVAVNLLILRFYSNELLGFILSFPLVVSLYFILSLVLANIQEDNFWNDYFIILGGSILISPVVFWSCSKSLDNL